MDRSSVITLISTTYTQDAIGQSVPVETQRDVFCNLRSVSRSEWATAGQMGLEAELVATMFAPDYRGEEIAEVLWPETEGSQPNPGTAVRYGVYRTYRGRNDEIELYMERKAGVTNG